MNAADRTHDEVRRDLAAYTLGALAPADRTVLEAHLEGCPSCRDELASLAAIPGLLGRLSLQDVIDPQPRPSEEERERLVFLAARQTRRRLRAWQGLAVACVLVAAVTVGAWAPWTGPAGTRHVGIPIAEAAARAEVTVFLEERDWGMYVTVQAAHLPDRRGYTVYAEDAEGHRAQVASWAHTGEPVTVEGSCYMDADSAVALLVVAAGDEIVVNVPLA